MNCYSEGQALSLWLAHYRLVEPMQQKKRGLFDSAMIFSG
jgi:hypothetical protein